MYVVMVASECAPPAKVGGLADVVLGLSRELEIRGTRWRSPCPSTTHALRTDRGLQITCEHLWVPCDGGAVSCTVWFGLAQGAQVLLDNAANVERKSEKTRALRVRLLLRDSPPARAERLPGLPCRARI
jgi:glycogen synthase